MQPIWDVFSQMLFYASPMLYVATMVPESYQRSYLANPVSALLTEMRARGRRPERAATCGTRSAAPSGCSCRRRSWSSRSRSALWVFKREAPRIAENL